MYLYDLGVSISPPNTQGKWTDADLAAIFGRRVINGMLEGRSPDHAEYYGRLAASYGRRALADLEVRREGWAVVRKVVGIF